MGYKILYEPGQRKYRAVLNIHWAGLVGFLLLVFSVALRLCQPDAVAVLRQYLIPSESAVMAWLENSNVSDVVQAFCQDVLDAG